MTKFYFRTEEFSYTIQNEAFSDNAIEPTNQNKPQRNAKLQDKRCIKTFNEPVVPTPIDECYPICFCLVYLIPICLVTGIVFVAYLEYVGSIVFFALAFLIIFGVIYQATSKYRGRESFMGWVKYFSMCFDFKSNLTLATAIGRYEENPVLSVKVRFLFNTSKNTGVV